MNLIERIKSYAGALPVLFDWTITGIVVDPIKAQSRADICTGRLNGNPCPKNTEDWPITEEVAGHIKRLVELKNGMELKVQGEKKLFTCAACGCPLKGKVWKELPTVLPDMSERVKYWDGCWVFSEQKL